MSRRWRAKLRVGSFILAYRSLWVRGAGGRLDEKSLLGSSAFLAHDFVVFLLLSVAQLKLPAIDSFVSRRVRE